MLFVLVEKVVENLLVKQSDSLEVVTGSWLETDDLIDKSV